MSVDFYSFISSQVLKNDFSVTVSAQDIKLEVNGIFYSEPLFDIYENFLESDITQLKKISDKVINNNDLNWELDFKEMNILKLWYMVTHERYLKDVKKYDKYGRLGFENVDDIFKEILKVPIADILSIELRKHLRIFTEKKPIVYLTCDYDHLNIWDTWHFLDFLKESFRCIKTLHFSKFTYTLFSYLFSRYFSQFNGYLNDKAFVESDKVINIAFFIPLSLNKFYDGVINYADKTISKFFLRLKAKNIEFGLHTSFEAKDRPDSILEQVGEMRSLSGCAPLSNRHHYLRFIFPHYLEVLEKAEVKRDFSLYYPETVAFRAGISSPFKVWNVLEGRPYHVEIIPTTLMDGTFTDYLFVDYEKALSLCIDKLNLSLKYGESVVLLWHNSSLFEYYRLNNYHPGLYIDIIEYLRHKELI